MSSNQNENEYIFYCNSKELRVSTHFCCSSHPKQTNIKDFKPYPLTSTACSVNTLPRSKPKIIVSSLVIVKHPIVHHQHESWWLYYTHARFFNRFLVTLLFLPFQFVNMPSLIFPTCLVTKMLKTEWVFILRKTTLLSEQESRSDDHHDRHQNDIPIALQ